MVRKIFTIFALLIGPAIRNTSPLPPNYSTGFIVEGDAIVGVQEDAKWCTEFRIYSNRGITAVAADAFDGCTVNKIMISDTVQHFYPVLEEGTVVNLVKDKASYHISFPSNVVVNEYACDEGFLNYWDANIRDNVTKSICNVSKTQYDYVKTLYQQLSPFDLNVVNHTSDGKGTIEDSMKYLENHFSSSPTQQKSKEIPQTIMISLILVIASFGMTAIGIFYVLKDKKVINQAKCYLQLWACVLKW